MSRSVNKVILIGNLTRDPEVRYTPQGNAVASFGLATNREWTIDGNKKEVVDFHNIVSWNKLAELCGQLLSKGSKIYVEGRLQTRDWNTEDGQKRYKTEVVIDEMIVLSNKRNGTSESAEHSDDTADSNGGTVIEDIDLDQVLSDGTFDTPQNGEGQ
jgi:single-strand DNA-binding protein